MSLEWQGEEDRALALRRLRWQARRGMLELDLILDAFLQKFSGAFPREEAQAFSQFLMENDDSLFDIVMKGEMYAGEDPFHFVPRLRNVSAASLFSYDHLGKKEK